MHTDGLILHPISVRTNLTVPGSEHPGPELRIPTLVCDLVFSCLTSGKDQLDHTVNCL